jgi:hypothetical protein
MAYASTSHRRLGVDPVRLVLAFPEQTYQIDSAGYRPDRGDCAPLTGPPSARVHFECLQCDEWWTANVGPAECPECGCAYVHRLNR